MSGKRATEQHDGNSTPKKNRQADALKEAEDSLVGMSSKCDEMAKSLEEGNEDINNQERELDALIKYYEEAKADLSKKRKEISKMKMEGEKHKQEVHSIIEKIKSVDQSFDILKETDTCEQNVNNWTQKCRELYGGKVERTKRKALQVIKAAWEYKITELESGLAFSYADNILDATSPLTLDKDVVKTGKVVAVQERGKERRYARLTLDGDAICLHHLQNQHPSTADVLVKYDAVFDKVDVPSALTFLDLSWKGSPPRRVYIQMKPKWRTDLGRQFVLMCSAMEGPTYAQTKLKEVRSKGRKGEYVVGGVVGKAIVKIEENEDEECLEEGIVAAEGSSSTLFKICTIESLNKLCKPFGRVEKGLEVVKEAAALGDVAEVTVMDCGVVLPEIPHIKRENGQSD